MTPKEEIERYEKDYAQQWPRLMQNPEFRSAVEQADAVKVGALAVEQAKGHLRTRKELTEHKKEKENQALVTQFKQDIIIEVRQFLNAKPFKRFIVSLLDKRSLEIQTPDCLSFVPGGDSIRVTADNGKMELIDLLNIATLKSIDR